MSVRWEYAYVSWTQKRRRITKRDPEYEQLSGEARREWLQRGWDFYWWYETSFSIALPSADEAEVRVAWTTGDPEFKTSFRKIFNELGSEGWELVSYTPYENAIEPRRGYSSAGTPVHIVAWLKRPVGE